MSAVQIRVFVVMPVVRGMPMPVVDVVKVIVVRDGTMPAAVAMDMVMFGRIVRPVPLGVRGHVGRLLPRVSIGRYLDRSPAPGWTR